MAAEGDYCTASAVSDIDCTLAWPEHQLDIIAINNVGLTNVVVHIELSIVTVLHAEVRAGELLRATHGKLAVLVVEYLSIESRGFSLCFW